MRPKHVAMTKPLARTLCAGALLGVLAGCQMIDHKPYGDATQAPALPSAAIGALVLDAEGDLFVVDGEGRTVQGCVPPGTMDPAAPECAALTGTTVMAIKSVALIRHTGSTCTTVGPIIHAGRAYYFQLPAGCAR
ncbi:MAG TPA: hypothetical protein PL143_19235 [Rhodocyclaceae bacterium]|nr:hypothetical protein [Rhodocyclaceae bacterium]